MNTNVQMLAFLPIYGPLAIGLVVMVGRHAGKPSQHEHLMHKSLQACAEARRRRSK